MGERRAENNNGGEASVKTLLVRVGQYLEAGQFDNAEKYCNRVLDIDPLCGEAWNNLLLVKVRASKKSELNKQLKKIILSPQDAAAFKSSLEFVNAKKYAPDGKKLISSIETLLDTICAKLAEKEKTRTAKQTAKLVKGGTASRKKTVDDRLACYEIDSAGCLKKLDNSRRLVEITIPINVKSIGDSAFSNLGSVERVSVAPGNARYYADGNCVIDRDTRTLVLGCKNSVIPTDGSVVRIGPTAFCGCDGLKSVTIPSGVTHIGRSAFYGCVSLETVNFPDSVIGIGDYAFCGCTKLRDITIPSVKCIGAGTFRDCKSLNGVVIPQSVEAIGCDAFSDCVGLRSVEIKYAVSIGDRAFYRCGSLKSVKIGYSVKRIGAAAFNGCQSLEELIIPDTVLEIGQIAFYCRSLKDVTISKQHKKNLEGIFGDARIVKQIKFTFI